MDIQDMRKLHPDKTVTSIYYELLGGGTLGDPPISLSTLQRYLKKMDIPVTSPVERKRFCF